MNIYTLLIKTKYFPDAVKHNQERYTSYVIDYADYSSIILEQLGIYRYRMIGKCVLGQENPEEFQSILRECSPEQTFFCNDRHLHIPAATYNDAIKRPSNYAIVLSQGYH